MDAPEAEADLSAILEFLHEQSPSAAVRLLDRLEALVRALDAERFEGPEEELVSGEHVRSSCGFIIRRADPSCAGRNGLSEPRDVRD